jgi:diadenosine tetraphosphate (Ap4A) HIT family hydrolase
MTTFALDKQLAQDTLAIIDWPMCRVLRMNDRNYPWLILVPRRPDVLEIIDLSSDDQRRLWAEVAKAAKALRHHTGAHKLNIAALGNVVRQLHVHVIGRFTTDAAWPRPIWGVAEAKRFSDQDIEREATLWRDRLAQ